jgi:hypothetical protein
MQSDTDQSCWDLRGPFLMIFANSPKKTCRPTRRDVAAVLSRAGRNQSRASRYRRVRRIGMRTPVYPTLRRPAQRSVYDVLEDGAVVGRIFLSPVAPADM